MTSAACQRLVFLRRADSGRRLMTERSVNLATPAIENTHGEEAVFYRLSLIYELRNFKAVDFSEKN